MFTFDDESLAAAAAKEQHGGGSTTQRSDSVKLLGGTGRATPQHARVNAKGEPLTKQQVELSNLGAQLGTTLPPRRQREMTRVFGQMAGEMTWKRSTHEIAREEAAKSYAAAHSPGKKSNNSSSNRIRSSSNDSQQGGGGGNRSARPMLSNSSLNDLNNHYDFEPPGPPPGGASLAGASLVDSESVDSSVCWAPWSSSRGAGNGRIRGKANRSLQSSRSLQSQQSQQSEAPPLRRRRRRPRQKLKTKEELVKEIDEFLRPKYDSTTLDLMEDARLEREAEAKAAVANVVAQEMAATNAAAAREKRRAAAEEDDDPESWGIASGNRQRQMYRHMHWEMEREGKEQAEKGSKGAKTKEELDALTEPSAFLLSKFPDLLKKKKTLEQQRQQRQQQRQQLRTSRSAPMLQQSPGGGMAGSASLMSLDDPSSLGVYSDEEDGGAGIVGGGGVGVGVGEATAAEAC